MLDLVKVAKLRNSFFRNTLLTSTKEELEKFKIIFPELFNDAKEIQVIPVSLLIEQARLVSINDELGDHDFFELFNWSDTLPLFKREPLVFTHDNKDPKNVSVFLELQNQMRGMLRRFPLILMLDKERYVVTYHGDLAVVNLGEYYPQDLEVQGDIHLAPVGWFDYYS
ncbi:MAG: hypothetical protein ACK4NC_02365 [Candidatus Gracilibacteria bacterium]